VRPLAVGKRDPAFEPGALLLVVEELAEAFGGRWLEPTLL
jgi:hypothetical protein